MTAGGKDGTAAKTENKKRVCRGTAPGVCNKVEVAILARYSRVADMWPLARATGNAIRCRIVTNGAIKLATTAVLLADTTSSATTALTHFSVKPSLLAGLSSDGTNRWSGWKVASPVPRCA